MDWVTILVVCGLVWAVVDMAILWRHQSRTRMTPRSELDQVFGKYRNNSDTEDLAAYDRLPMYGYYGRPSLARIALLIVAVVLIGALARAWGM